MLSPGEYVGSSSPAGHTCHPFITKSRRKHLAAFFVRKMDKNEISDILDIFPQFDDIITEYMVHTPKTKGDHLCTLKPSENRQI